MAYVRDHWDDVASRFWDEVSWEYDYKEMTYELEADLDMTAASWVPLGSSYYNGTFNGNGHTIKIRIDGATDNYQGLFADVKHYVGRTGTVRNLHVVGSIHCSSSRMVGGIAGYNSGLIENCWVSAEVRSDWTGSTYYAKVGGIVGQNTGTIRYCCMSGNVTNYDEDVAGLVGYNNGTVDHCTFYGTVACNHDREDSKFIGDQSEIATNLYDEFNQGEYDAASGKDMYRQALMYPYTVSISTMGEGTVTASPTKAYPGQTITLNVTSERDVAAATVNT